ncbi:sodium- and chloride-dependent betaine transporter-like [Penaeus monodon]|uniref:sodium- and chloride-dependent betaine transporter-like n=1 Tax=Penaeus monodon TaxID=6687 RepID=UPI0018A712B1|nr:sodium- and chloride-dependent betaine transporter-like [Penaeus monodon]
MSEPKAAGSAEAAKGAEEERGTWGNQCEFFLSCLGYAVGFGNVWRFPYLCYKNGGAAFLIPYTIMLLFSGLPIFFMELALGQYVSLGPALLFPKLAPVFSGLGWGMVVIPLLTALSFNVIIAWSFFYIFASFSDVLPWSRCDNDFNSINCFTDAEAEACKNSSLVYYNRTCLSVGDYCGLAGLGEFNKTHCHDPANGSAWVRPVETVLTRISASEDYFKNRMLGVTGRSWDDMGGLRWELVGCLALAWVIVGACLAKGIKSSGKVVYFTALFPYVILAILFVRGITLDGAMKGIDFYFLQPDFSRLKEVEVWSDAAIQIFYSLGVSFGCLITLSSYNKFNNNCMRDAIIIAFSNCSTSVFSGFVIFSILGFLAQELGVEVKDVASSGSGLAFIVYPAAVSLLPLPQLWSVLFFVMLINIGLASQLTMVETVTTTLFDYMPSLRHRKPLVVACVCFVIFLLGLSMCLEGGILMFELFFWYSAGISVIILAIAQIVGVVWVYGFRRFLSNIKEMGVYIPAPLKAYWLATWVFITPVMLVVICFFYIYFFVPAYWGDYVFPANIQILGWLLSASSMGLIPLGALAAICKTKSFRELFQTSPDLCPAHVRSQRAAQEERPAASFEYDNAAFEETQNKLYPELTPTE